MRKLISLLVLILFASCNKISSKLRSDKYWAEESLRIEDCRKKWNYKTFNDVIELEILDFQQSHYETLISFPNFFIGVTTKNDTIGMIVYDENPELNRGAKIKEIANTVKRIQFIPSEPKRNKSRVNFYLEESLEDYPIFYTSPKRKNNDLQCAVESVYYGRILN